MIDWHRLFGITLVDFFAGHPVVVELEKDLSMKQQLLDVVIVTKDENIQLDELPDGLDNLSRHNLLTYKSHQETLGSWAILELLGHYVNYRKQMSPTTTELLPKELFCLYAVSTRYPQKLFGAQEHNLRCLKEGVYELMMVGTLVRVLVLSEMPEEESNAIWLLFSAQREKVALGTNWYRQHFSHVSGIINQLFKHYQEEGIDMPYTMHDFQRDLVEDNFSELTPQEREEILNKLPPEERLKGLPAEERLVGLSAEERLKGLPAEERLKGLPAEERLVGLSAEERKALKALLDADESEDS